MNPAPRRASARMRPLPTLVTVLLAVELLIEVPLAVDLRRLSSPAGTVRAYLRAAHDGDCDRLVDLRTDAVREAGVSLAGTREKWCGAQRGARTGPARTVARSDVTATVTEAGLTLAARRVHGRWRVGAIGPCQDLPQAWRDVEPACNLAPPT